VMIARRLVQDGYEAIIADPLALDGAGAVLGDTVVAIHGAEAAIAAADIVVVATPAHAFAALGPEVFARGGRRLVVLDCWRILADAVAEVADVVHLGRGLAEPAVRAKRG